MFDVEAFGYEHIDTVREYKHPFKDVVIFEHGRKYIIIIDGEAKYNGIIEGNKFAKELLENLEIDD